MAWRGIHISNPARLRLVDKKVEVEQDSGSHRFPLEDVDWIILDTPQATVTAKLLSECAGRNIPLIVSDEKHMPSGALLPLPNGRAHVSTLQSQINTSKALKNRLWQAIIRRKIENQAAVLAAIDCDAAKPVREMAKLVKSGDPNNVEARAARAYWPALFDDFRRHDDDRTNALLNYGYAVVRAVIARTLAAHGFVPAIGLHHAGDRNPFNLADDMIEPFRPLVDFHALERVGMDGEMLDLDDRRHMGAVLTLEVQMDGGSYRLPQAVEVMIAGLRKALEFGEAGMLDLPTLPSPLARAA